MHRDLKPENLLFRKEGDFDCVIADFGLAEFSEIAEYLFVRCGTPGYVAPEVINIKDMKTKYKPICDMFSLGLIFHLLLFGRSAFPGTTYNEVLSQNRACNINFSEDDTKKIGTNAMDLLQRMLKKAPLDRISAEEALKHPYFTIETSMIDEVTEEESQDIVNGVDSPLLTSANPKRKNDRNVKKDSCVEFKMGKENLMTGKTETVGTMGSKLSGVEHSETMKKAKMSQFCAEKR